MVAFSVVAFSVVAFSVDFSVVFSVDAFSEVCFSVDFTSVVCSSASALPVDSDVSSLFPGASVLVASVPVATLSSSSTVWAIG